MQCVPCAGQHKPCKRPSSSRLMDLELLRFAFKLPRYMPILQVLVSSPKACCTGACRFELFSPTCLACATALLSLVSSVTLVYGATCDLIRSSITWRVFMNFYMILHPLASNPWMSEAPPGHASAKPVTIPNVSQRAHPHHPSRVSHSILILAIPCLLVTAHASLPCAGAALCASVFR